MAIRRRRIKRKPVWPLLCVIVALGLCVYVPFYKAHPFTGREWAVLLDGEGDIMRLWTVEDPEDSLLLRRSCRELSAREIASKDMRLLMRRMLATVQNPENRGVGIAAPQVGISRRLVAVQRFDKAGEPFEFYPNIYITWFSPETAVGREGCLSIPGRRGLVRRSESIEIVYTDVETCEPVTERIEGFTAVIFQHEVDHLDGVLYIDKMEEEIGGAEE